MKTATDIIQGITQEQARGCRFCDSKAVHYASTGMEFWHADTNCCNPTRVLQAVWRRQDHDRVAAELNRTADARARRDLEGHLADLNAEYQRCARNLLENVATEEELEQAIREAREAGFVNEDFRTVRAAFIGRKHGRPA